MTYFLLETPFGRFAASIITPELAARALSLEPIGSLAEIPLYPEGSPLAGYLDTDALTAEGRRQIEADETPAISPYLVPSPVFKINGKSYRGRVTVGYVESPHDTRRWVRISNYGGATSSELTDAARTKIADWMEAHEAEIFTPERISAYENARLIDHAETLERELAKLDERRFLIQAELAELHRELDEATR